MFGRFRGLLLPFLRPFRRFHLLERNLALVNLRLCFLELLKLVSLLLGQGNRLVLQSLLLERAECRLQVIIGFFALLIVSGVREANLVEVGRLFLELVKLIREVEHLLAGSHIARRQRLDLRDQHLRELMDLFDLRLLELVLKRGLD